MSVPQHQPEFDEEELGEEEELVMERDEPPPRLSSIIIDKQNKNKKTKKKAKKNGTKKKKRQEPEPQLEPESEPEEEEEEEQEDEDLEKDVVVVVVTPEPEPAKKQRKVWTEHKMKGERLRLIPSYRVKLSKNREKNAKKRAEQGKDAIPERKKVQAGTIARLESRYLQNANGLLVPSALIRRVVIQESANTIAELQKISASAEGRMRARGKDIPATFAIKDVSQWQFSDNAIELIRAAVQDRLEDVAEAASDMRRMTGRVTVKGSDIEDALHFTRKYA